MATKIKKRTDGRYSKHFRYEGKQYTVYGSTLDEAERNKVKKLEELKNGVIKQINPTLNEYYKVFTEDRRLKVKSATLRGQIYAFRNCADIVINDNGKTLGEMHMKDIKPFDISKVQLGLTKRNLSVRSINDYMAHLSHVFYKAVDQDIITKNPCKPVSKLRETEKPASETNHRALSIEETHLFLDNATGSRYINAFKLMLQTGMRVGELSALKYSDIDYKAGCIHVSKTITRDESGSYLIGDSTKTTAGSRDIPLNPIIIEIIEDQKELMNMICGSVRPLDDLLFKSPTNDILREYQINREIKRITKSCKIEHFTCHAFRATFATRFIEQRPQDYKVLSEILGHSDIKITLNLYTHVMNDKKVTAMNSIVIAM